MSLFRIFITICCVFFLFVDGQSWAAEPSVRVAIRTGPRYIIELPMEEYLLGVLATELPSAWPEEALKAQAVAARTYALYRKAHPKSDDFDLEATVNDQVFQFRGVFPENVVHAVRATRGQTLWWEGEPIPAFFHSCCGGHTETAEHVWTWADASPFFQVKPDPYCHQCPDEQWDYQLNKDELSILLQSAERASGQVTHVIPIATNGSSRNRDIAILTDAETIQLTGNRFRQLIGYDRLRSTAFNVLEVGEDFHFVGSGYGHGVGLCQWGARGMSEQGKSYQEILEFYYPGVELKRVY